MKLELVDGLLVEVPAAVEEEGPAAVEAWYHAQHGTPALKKALADREGQRGAYQALVAEHLADGHSPTAAEAAAKAALAVPAQPVKE